MSIEPLVSPVTASTVGHVPAGLAIQTADRIDFFGPDHVADLDHDGALKIVDSRTGEAISSYRGATWTLRFDGGAR